ncbi:hypothetical protein ACWDYH_36370 [Nocardia goodfellowii]
MLSSRRPVAAGGADDLELVTSGRVLSSTISAMTIFGAEPQKS